MRVRLSNALVASVLIASFVAGTSDAAAANKGDITYREYKILKPQDKYIETVYLAGMVEGFAWANGELTEARNAKPLFCQPSNLDLTTEQDVSILDGYIGRHPEKAEQRLGILAQLALEETFPCASEADAPS